MAKMTKLARLALNKLLEYVLHNSLPEGYTGVEDWLYDFWPDLSWMEGRDADIHAILGAPEFSRIEEFFQARYQFNFELELKKGLAHVYCAWCGKDMGEVSEELPGTSHSMCTDCEENIENFVGPSTRAKDPARDP